ncbi:MAG: hypothetical protein MJE77_24130 [Proteobacteria bacterium]|nr:hypothetical protein [Pseudomonadota bacterium]
MTIALVLVPIAVDLLASHRGRSFDYVAADSFYYLTVSRNIVEHGQVSFDQRFATNGFHPLWQFALTVVYWAGDLFGLAPNHIVTAAVLVCAGLLALGIYWIGVAMARRSSGISALYMLVPLGIYSLLLSICYFYLGDSGMARQRGAEGTLPLYGTMWSYANGMESALLIACYGASVFWYTTRQALATGKHMAVLGGLLCLFVFARLDHIFMALAAVAAVAGWTLLSRQRASLRRAVLLAAAFAAPIAVYMLINRIYFGSAIPSSGQLKTVFPRFTNANIDAFGIMLDALQQEGKWLFLAWRLAQIVIPALIALCYLALAIKIRPAPHGLAIELRRQGDRYEHALVVTAFGVIFLALYNFFFVPYGNQGHWYFPISTLFVTLAVIRWLEFCRIVENLRRNWTCLGSCAAAASALSIAFFLVLHRTPDYHARYADFYFDKAPRVRQHFGSDVPRLFSVDDGIVAFSLGFPTMSGTGLAGDPELVRHAKARTTGNLAVDRGYRNFTSLVYYDLSRFTAESSSASIGRWMIHPFRLKNPHKYRFEVDFRLPGFAIVRVERR